MKWKEMTVPYRILFVISIVCAVTGLFFMLFDFVNIIKDGASFAGVLICVSGILQAVIDWKPQRTSSLISVILWSLGLILYLYRLIFLK